MLRRKFIALDAHLRIEERPKVNNLSFQLRKLEKEEKITSKVRRIREIIRIRRADIMELKTGNY